VTKACVKMKSDILFMAVVAVVALYFCKKILNK
jgi:hypothetical protein